MADPTNSLSTYLPSRRHRTSLLYTAHWPYRCLMGPHHPQPPCPRCYVLVLFSIRKGRSDMVERVDHAATNHPIRHRSWYICFHPFLASIIELSQLTYPRIRLLCLLYLLLLHLFPPPPHGRPVRRRRVRRVRGHRHP